MYGFIPVAHFLLSMMIITSRAQLTNIAGSTSVSLSPTDATCGRTSPDSYCRVDLSADASCVVRTCRTVTEDTGSTYRDLLDGVSSFNYNGSMTSASKDFSSGNVTVLEFNKRSRLAFLKGIVNMTGLDEFTLTFCVRPDDMDAESSVIDIHGASNGERMLNVRLGSDLGITVVSGTTSATRQTWRLPRHAWSHIAVQFRPTGVNVYLNRNGTTTAAVELQLHSVGDTANLQLKIGQTYVSPKGSEEWSYVCPEGRGKAHPTYCDVYYFCEGGVMKRKKCVYPDRWSIEHEQCDNFQTVSCGKRIPKNHPCDREVVGNHFYRCNLIKHPVNCTGQKNGLYVKFFASFGCVVYGCIDGTLATLADGPLAFFPDEPYGATIFRCPESRLINPDTGKCEKQAECSSDTDLYVADSPYLRCSNADVRTYRYDSCKYWRCQNNVWMVERCPEDLVWSDSETVCVSGTGHCAYVPESVDTKERQYIGQLADIRLYEIALTESEINELYSPICSVWGRDAHPIDYAVDSDSSSFWLSRAHLDSVDLLFDLRRTYSLEEISMTFFGPVPLVVSIFKKVTADDSWQLWRVFRDDCSNVSKCTQIGAIKLDDKRLTYNLLEASLGPLQRRASSLRVRLSGHRHEGAAQLRNISYFGLYNFVISRRVSSPCGVFGYLVRESSTSCLPCKCDVRGVIDGNLECNEIGGQCACKRYVTGRRCDRCLSGYDNIRQSDPDGCSSLTDTVTSPIPQVTSDQETSTPSNSKAEPSTSTTESSTPWLLYITPACVLVVVAILIIIAIICVRRRRQRDSAHTTEGPVSELDPTYETMPVTSDDATCHDAMTKRGSSKVQMRLSGHTAKKIVDSNYLEPYSSVASSPDYHRPLSAGPDTPTPEHADETKRHSDPSGRVDSDNIESSRAAVGGPDYQRPVPAVPVPVIPEYTDLTTRRSLHETANSNPDYLDILDGADNNPATGLQPTANEGSDPSDEGDYDNAITSPGSGENTNAVG